MKNKYILFTIIGLITIVFYACNNNKSKNHLSFSNFDSVQVAIKELDTILHKLPKTEGYKLKHYHIKEDGSLIINKIKINSLNSLSIEDLNIPEISNYLTELEKRKMLYNILYLHKNNISDAIQGESIWQFNYLYHTRTTSDYATHRMVIVVYNPIDTSNAYFRWSKEILDSQYELVLYKDITEYKDLNESPPYPPRINPYTKAPAQ